MHRQRRWDEVIAVPAPAALTGEAQLVALGGGRVLVERGTLDVDPGALLGSLRTPPPYRALVVPRDDGLTGVAARRIEVVELADDPGGDAIELSWDGVELVVRVDGVESPADVAELRSRGGQRFSTYVVAARRLEGRLWEVDVTPL